MFVCRHLHCLNWLTVLVKQSVLLHLACRRRVWGAYLVPADGKSLHDAGVRSFVTYSVPHNISSGILLAREDKCSDELLKKQDRWHGNHFLHAWCLQFDAGTRSS